MGRWGDGAGPRPKQGGCCGVTRCGSWLAGLQTLKYPAGVVAQAPRHGALQQLHC